MKSQTFFQLTYSHLRRNFLIYPSTSTVLHSHFHRQQSQQQSIGNGRINYNQFRLNLLSSPQCHLSSALSSSIAASSANENGTESKLLISPEAIESLEKSKNTKLLDLKACAKFIEDNKQINDHKTKEKCNEFAKQYEEFISMHRKDDTNYKKFYLQMLFGILESFYQEMAKRKIINDDALIGKINSVLDCLSDITILKRHCLVGSVLLADNQQIKFIDYLKREKTILKGEYVSFICRIAKVAKKAQIIEPLIGMPEFLPSKPHLLAKLYENLALIYGKQEQLDKLDWLWRHILKSHTKRGDLSSFKPSLHRIGHFYKLANKKLPKELARELNNLDNRGGISFKFKRPINKQQKEAPSE